MKTFNKYILIVSLLAGAVTVTFAGPGIQYWQNHGVAKATAIQKPNKVAHDGTGLTCRHMLVPNLGPGAHRVPWKSVNCTAEMLKNDPRCQAACRS